MVFAVLAATLAMFVWGRWRYDLVAILALLALLATGVLPFEQAFQGFSHPAVITVAAVLVLSRALQNAGLVDLVVRVLTPLKGKMALQLVAQTVIVAVLSAFMNNVGALALMLPVALRQAYRDGYAPAISLMPLAFGSLLGGLTTLIGTPPNIIVSTFRVRELGEPYGMFAFAPVGGVVALAGIAFVTLVGWRLIPKDRRGSVDPEHVFDVADYVTEVRVATDSALVGNSLTEVEALVDDEEVMVIGIVRDEARRLAPRGYERVQAGDVLVVEGETSGIKALLAASDLTLEEDKAISRADLGNDEVTVQEVIVAPGSSIEGRSPRTAQLRTRYRVNLLAVARHGKRIERRLADVRFQTGDVLLLQGPSERVGELTRDQRLLPLAERDVGVAKPQRLLLTGSLMAGAIAAVMTGLAPAHVAFVAAAAALVLIGVLGRDEPYRAIDWPVIVLLAALIPVGTALELTGGTALLADGVLALTGGLGPVWVLVTLMVVTMLLSDVVNNNATAVLMAPLAIDLAQRLDVALDPLLMAVAIGASCAFLTPIGHQSNTLVLKPGGYRFGDYWRLGLPLEVVIVLVSVPMILLVWPL
ncbi:MAG: SLC13 family permease [Trueperaceae bacterium]|nr:MAG: SLC13 family permease [Trueperaceae bacterium]